VLHWWSAGCWCAAALKFRFRFSDAKFCWIKQILLADDWVNDFMICYAERETFKGLDGDVIMKQFQAIKTWRINLPCPP
jgi:hypothetical protein